MVRGRTCGICNCGVVFKGRRVAVCGLGTSTEKVGKEKEAEAVKGERSICV